MWKLLMSPTRSESSKHFFAASLDCFPWILSDRKAALTLLGAVRIDPLAFRIFAFSQHVLACIKSSCSEGGKSDQGSMMMTMIRRRRRRRRTTTTMMMMMRRRRPVRRKSSTMKGPSPLPGRTWKPIDLSFPRWCLGALHSLSVPQAASLPSCLPSFLLTPWSYSFLFLRPLTIVHFGVFGVRRDREEGKQSLSNPSRTFDCSPLPSLYFHWIPSLMSRSRWNYYKKNLNKWGKQVMVEDGMTTDRVCVLNFLLLALAVD